MTAHRPRKSPSHPRSKRLYRLIRRVLGARISDRRIAHRLGLDTKTLYKLKYGRSPVPRLERLKSLARTLGIAEAEVLASVSAPKVPAPGACSVFTLPPPASPDEFLGRCAFLFENVYDAVIVTDPAGRIVEWNPAAERLYGYSRREMLGKSAEILNRPGEGRKLTKEIMRAIKERGRWSGQISFVRKDGSEGITKTAVIPVRDGRGKTLALISFDQDITELSRRADALRESARKLREEACGREKAQQDLRLFRELIDQSQDFISIIDLETGYFLYVNEATRRATGFSEKQWLKWRVADIDPTISERWDARSARRERLRRRTRGVFVREGSLRRKSGDAIPVEIVSSIVSAGGKDYLVAIARDISDRMRAITLICAQRDLASALNSVSRLEEGLRLCLETGIKVGGMDSGGLYLFDAAAGTFNLHDHTGLSPRFMQAVSFLPPKSEKTRIILKGKPIYSRYDLMISRLSEAERKEGLKAIAVIPLQARGKVIGCLIIASHTREEVPPAARDALEGVAAQMGAAIVRLRTRDEMEGINRLLSQRTDALMRLNRCFLSLGLDPRRNIEIIIAAAGEILRAGSALYVRRATDDGSLRIANAWHPPPGLDLEIKPIEGGLCSDVIASGKAAPLVLPDVKGSSYEKTDPHVAAYGLRSYLGFPIRLYKKTLGALCLCDGRPRAFTVEELKTAEILARAIALEEERLQALENLRRSEEEYRQLVEGASDCVFSTDPKGTFLFANPATLRAADYTLSGLRKRTYLNLVLPEWRRRIQLHYMRQYLSRSPTSYIEYPFRAKGGRIVWFGQKASLRIETGEIVGFDCISRDITAQKLAEESLRASETKYRYLFEKSQTLNLMIGTDGKIAAVNDCAAESFGFTRDELIGRDPLELVVPERREDTGRMLELELAGENTPQIEAEIDTPKGRRTLLFAESRGEVVEGGVLRGLIFSALDVTNLKKAQEAFEKSEKEYRGIVEDLPALLCRFLPDGRLTFVNEAYCRYFGKPREDLIGKSSLSRVVEEDRRIVEKAFASLSAANPVVTYEHRVVGVRGDIRWQRWTDRAICDETGAMVEYQSIGEDITERKRAEVQLRYQAGLLANVNDAIIASDSQYRLTAWNAAAELLYGWKAEEVLGRNGLEIVRTEWPTVDADEMRRTIAETGCWRGEATQARKDGTRIPVEVSSMVLRDESGQIAGYVSVNRNISERKKLEEELARHREHLEELVGKRTVEYKKLIDLMTGREVRMAELKKVIAKLREQLKSRGIKPEAGDPLEE